jgi:hypothetical protein
MLATFLHSTMCPMLVPIGALYSVAAFVVESYCIARSVFIRQTDMYLDELIKTTFRFTNFAVLLKLVVSMIIYAKIDA